MNSTSLLIVIIATALGATVLYIIVILGMGASDDFASRLSVASTNYIEDRAKADEFGLNPEDVYMPAARTQRPADYDPSLSAVETSPYVRPDSDEVSSADKALAGNTVTTAADELVREEELLDESTVATNAENAASEDKDEDGKNESAENIDPESSITAFIKHQLETEELTDSKRKALESLLPKPATADERAVDVRLQFNPDDCVVPRNSDSWIGVLFRQKSTAIRGASLTKLDNLIFLRDRCGGTLIVEDVNTALENSTTSLRERRRDEVKYYLLKRRVPKEFIQMVVLGD